MVLKRFNVTIDVACRDCLDNRKACEKVVSNLGVVGGFQRYFKVPSQLAHRFTLTCM